MTKRVLWILAISITFFFSGCDSGEQPKNQTAPHQAAKPEKSLKAEEEKPAAAVNEKVEEVVKETKEAIQESTENVVEVTKETVAEAEKESRIAVAKVATATENKMEEIKKAVTPAEIIFEASYGNVTFMHGKHADQYECKTCHEDLPGPFDITKEVAHDLCKGCHKDAGAGPTSCKGCHVK